MDFVANDLNSERSVWKRFFRWARQRSAMFTGTVGSLGQDDKVHLFQERFKALCIEMRIDASALIVVGPSNFRLSGDRDGESLRALSTSFVLYAEKRNSLVKSAKRIIEVGR